MVRVVTPFWRILPRLTLPIVTQPNERGNMETGTGDLNLFITFLLTKPTARFQAGVGPLYVAPTASFENAGQGKHQLGAALIFVYSGPKFLGGTLTTYQAAIAGDEDRPFVQTLVHQFFAIFQVGGGWYVRSAPVWQFDLQRGNFNIPIGLGAGKVVLSKHVITNLFLEPQAIVAKYGDLAPGFQLFLGINLQFPVTPKKK